MVKVLVSGTITYGFKKWMDLDDEEIAKLKDDNDDCADIIADNVDSRNDLDDFVEGEITDFKFEGEVPKSPPKEEPKEW